MKIKVHEVRGFDPAIKGMRFPMDSNHLSDSYCDIIGPNDLELCRKLIKAGPSHRKFLRQIMIWVEVTASLKWWDEFDTYLHTVKNSSSQMHKLGNRLLNKDDFENHISDKFLSIVNSKIMTYMSEKNQGNWRAMIDVIPQSFLYKRMVMLNYETILTMYPNRINHKMFEWKAFLREILAECAYLEMFLSFLLKEEENND